MITADTITDDQIRELRDRASGEREITIMHFALAALGLDPTANRIGPAAIISARTRCAEILSARTNTIGNELAAHMRRHKGELLGDGWAGEEFDRLYLVWTRARWDEGHTWTRSVWKVRP